MSEIKLFRPQRLTDNSDGGGLATSTEIVDGQINNLFDDISRIDRVNGEFSLRKAFVIAATADTALYSDVHLIVAQPPMDPRVSAVIFKTGVWDDQRDAAKSAVERYLDPSVISRMIPYDRQLQGQRTVLVFQRKELAVPDIGQVFDLANDTLGTNEFVRITDMSHEVQTFTDPSGDFQARVITLTISQPLSAEFSGSQPNRFFTADTGKSIIRKTVASDAARYKGVVALAEDAAIGDLSIKVETIFAQLVPAAISEVAVADAQPTGVVALVPAALVAYSEGSVTSATSGHSFLQASVMPGTLSMATDTAGTWTDDGKGSIKTASGTVVGSINYQTGAIDWAGAGGHAITASFKPAAVVAKSALSYAIPVETANRGYVYVATLHPIPAPGSTVVSFRAQGAWYTLEDDGSGALVGATGVGTGLVNFATGTVSISLGALPDIGSEVIIAFGATTEFEIRTGDVSIASPSVKLTLASGNCEPGTFHASWLAGAVTKNAADDGAGNITGDASGRLVYSTGEVFLTPTVLPNSNALFTFTYHAGTTQEDDFAPSVSGGNLSLTLSVPPRPGSLRIGYSGIVPAVLGSGYISYARVLTDNAAGALVDAAGVVIAGSNVNYTTGLITFNPSFDRHAPGLTRTSYENPLARTCSRCGDGRLPHPAAWRSIGATQVVSWPTPRPPSSTPHRSTSEYKDNGATDDDVITGDRPSPRRRCRIDSDAAGHQRHRARRPAVRTLGGLTYYDQRRHSLNHSMSTATGAGTCRRCTIDYSTGVATAHVPGRATCLAGT
jgi:hypothetical protein